MPDLLPMLVMLIFITLCHEFGHMAAARRLGIPVKRVYIGFGPELGYVALRPQTELVLRALPLGMSIAVPADIDAPGQAPRRLRPKFWLALAGSAANILLALICFTIARLMAWEAGAPTAAAYLFVDIGLLSMVIAGLNLLPIPGLDGGHLLSLGLQRTGWRWSASREARLQRVGLAVAVGASLAAMLAIAWREFGLLL